MKQVIKTLFLALFALFIFTGCVATQSKITQGEYHSKLYQNHPTSILVLPAVNTTTSVDATDHFRYTITKPLAEKGYYVFPVHLVDEFFKSENIVDASIIRDIPVEKLQEIFNADAILYVNINAWDTGYRVLNSNVDVGLSFSLINAKTGAEIWNNNAYAYSYEGWDGSGGIIGMVVSAIATAVNTSTDYTKLASSANHAGVRMLPYGKYHKKYKVDAKESFTFMDSSKVEGDRVYVSQYFVKGIEKEGEGKIPLTVRQHIKGYHAFSVINYDMFTHSGYSDYYITEDIQGKKYLRNRFFKYENNKPYLLSESNKVFVYSELDGKIPVSEENGKYYFQIVDTVALVTDKK